MTEGPILHTMQEGDAAVPSSTPPNSSVTPPPDPAGGGDEVVEPAASGEVSSADVEDFSQCKVGDVMDGVEIHHILLQYADAVVFTSPTGSIHFRQNVGERGDSMLVEFYRLTTKSSARLKQAYARQVNGLIGSALAEALSSPEKADLRVPFKAVDEFIDDVGPIKYVFGASEQWVVFVDKAGEIVCDYPKVTDKAAPLITEFYRLRELGKSSLRHAEVGALTHILGTELSIALQRTPPVDTSDAFVASRDFIQLRNESRMRIRYVSASISAALAFGLAAWAIVPDTALLVGCIGGIIGAAISVLQRSADLEIRRFLPATQVITQGAVRVTLGVLFGVLIVVASRAGVVSEAMAANANAAFIAGVVAGFSERFVPDLLSKVASDSSPSNEKK